MTELKTFSDDVIKGKWARIMMADGNPCFLAIGPRSIVIKKSKSGVIGPKLYEIRNLKQIECVIEIFTRNYCDDLTPAGMTNSILKPAVNAVLHCKNLDQVLSVFKTAQSTLSEKENNKSITNRAM